MRKLLLRSILALALATALPVRAHAADELPPGVVARVYGNDITETQVHARLARRFEGTERGADALEQMIEDACVAREAAAREVSVSEKEAREYLQKVDEKVRFDSGGVKSLLDVYREQNTTEAEFLRVVRDFLLRQKMAKADMGSSAGLGESQFGIPGDLPMHRMKLWLKSLRARHDVKTKELPEGVLAVVDGEQITRESFAASIATRLPQEIVAGFRDDLVFEAAVQKHLADAGVELTDADVGAEIARLRARFAEDPRVVGSGVTFDQFLRQSTGAGESELARDPSFRARLGLRLLMLDKVTPERIKEHWELNREAYGEQVLLRSVFMPAQSGTPQIGQDKLKPFDDVRDLMLQTKVAVLKAAGMAGALPDGTTPMPLSEAVTAVAKTLVRDPEKKQRAGEPEVWTKAGVANEGELAERVFEGPLGVLQGPLRTSVGYYLILVEERRPAPKFEEIQEKLTEDLLRLDLMRWRRNLQIDPDVITRDHRPAQPAPDTPR